MAKANESKVVLTDTKTTTKNMLTPEMEAQLQKLECWRREQRWTEEVMHGLAVSDGAEHTRLFFEQVMYTVKNDAPEHLVPFMNVYVRGLKDGVQVPDSLEYAVLFQQTDLLREILDRYERNPFWQEWVKVYHFLLSVLEGTLTLEEILEQSLVLTHEVNDTSLQLRLELVDVVAHMHLKNYDKARSLLEHFSSRLELLELSFMRSALRSRAELNEANILLCVDGNASKAEKKFSAVIMNNATPSALIVTAYRDRGFSILNEAMLEKSNKCLRCFEIAISRAKEFGLMREHEKLTKEAFPFVQNLHCKQFDATDVVQDEQAHQYIVRGEHENLIQELESNGKGGVFLTFYKAKALKDRELMSRVREQFKAKKIVYMVPIVDREIQALDNEFKGGRALMKRILYGFIVMLFLVVSAQDQALAEVSSSGGKEIEPSPWSVDTHASSCTPSKHLQL